MTILDIDLSEDAVPELRLLSNGEEVLARLESCTFGESKSSGREMYTLFYSFPEEENVQGVSAYVSLPTEAEMTATDVITKNKRNNMLRNLREFYKRYDVDYLSAPPDTDEVCARLSAEKPEHRVIVGYNPESRDESTGEEYPASNKIKRFL